MSIIENNYYQRLKIECDEYGLPIKEVSDEIIKKAYIERLKEFYIALQQTSIIEPQTTNKQRTRQEEETQRKRRLMKKKEDEAELNRILKNIDENDRNTIICYLEYYIKSNKYLYIKPETENFYTYLDEAYHSIDTEQKREQYNKYISKITNKKLLDALSSYNVPIIHKNLNDNDTLYGDLVSKGECKVRKFVYWSKNLRMFVEEENEAYKIVQGEHISDIKRIAASLKKVEELRYSIIVRNSEEDDEWISKEFYSGRDIATKLSMPYKDTKNSQILLERQQQLLSGILTVLQEAVKNNQKYLGEIVLTDNGIVCVNDEKMKKRIEELEERRQSKRKQISEGPKIEKFMGGR